MPTNKTQLFTELPAAVISSKDQVVLDIITTAYLANKQQKNIFRFDYVPSCDSLTVIVAKSKQRYNDWLYRLSIFVDDSSLEELLKFKEALMDLIAGEELDMDMFPPDNYEGLMVGDHRNDPPYEYAEDETDVAEPQ